MPTNVTPAAAIQTFLQSTNGTVPTAAPGTSTTDAASTAFVQTSFASPPDIGTGTPGAATVTSFTATGATPVFGTAEKNGTQLQIYGVNDPGWAIFSGSSYAVGILDSSTGLFLQSSVNKIRLQGFTTTTNPFLILDATSITGTTGGATLGSVGGVGMLANGTNTARAVALLGQIFSWSASGTATALTVTSFSVTATGLMGGDFVIVNVPDALPGGIGVAYVKTGTDSLQVYISNSTAVDVSLSGTIYFQALRF